MNYFNQRTNKEGRKKIAQACIELKQCDLRGWGAFKLSALIWISRNLYKDKPCFTENSLKMFLEIFLNVIHATCFR